MEAAEAERLRAPRQRTARVARLDMTCAAPRAPCSSIFAAMRHPYTFRDPFVAGQSQQTAPDDAIWPLTTPASITPRPRRYRSAGGASRPMAQRPQRSRRPVSCGSVETPRFDQKACCCNASESTRPACHRGSPAVSCAASPSSDPRQRCVAPSSSTAPGRPAPWHAACCCKERSRFLRSWARRARRRAGLSSHRCLPPDCHRAGSARPTLRQPFSRLPARSQ